MPFMFYSLSPLIQVVCHLSVDNLISDYLMPICMDMLPALTPTSLSQGSLADSLSDLFVKGDIISVKNWLSKFYILCDLQWFDGDILC